MMRFCVITKRFAGRSHLSGFRTARVSFAPKKSTPPPPVPPAQVLDVGGATGVHASWLAQDGYQVRLVDISPRHVAKANSELGSLGVVAELGDARALAAPADSYDVVLLFGPLYHLPARDDRLVALREAARVTRPGGVVAGCG